MGEQRNLASETWESEGLFALLNSWRQDVGSADAPQPAL